MKTSLWFLALALGVMCLFLWSIAHMETGLLKAASFPLPLPPMTEMLVTNPNWLWFCPIPWIFAALLLSFRKEISFTQGFVFLSTVILAGALILMPFLTAAALPWFALFVHSISKLH